MLPCGRDAGPTFEDSPVRDSDRFINPRVVALLIVCATVLLLAVIAALTWLTDRGMDPDPVLKLTAQVGGGVAGVLSLLLQLVNRATLAKTERNTGLAAQQELPALRAELEANTDDTRQLAGALNRVAEALPRPVPRHSFTDTVAAPAAR